MAPSVGAFAVAPCASPLLSAPRVRLSRRGERAPLPLLPTRHATTLRMGAPLAGGADDGDGPPLPMGMSIPGFSPDDVAYVSAANGSADFIARMNERMNRVRKERGIGNEARGKVASDSYVDNLRRFSAAAPDAQALADAAATAVSPEEAIQVQRAFDNAGENYMRDLATASAVARSSRAEDGSVADTRALLAELSEETAGKMASARGNAGGRGLDAPPLPLRQGDGWGVPAAGGSDALPSAAAVPPAADGGQSKEEAAAEAEDAIEAAVRAMREKLGVPEDDDDDGGDAYPVGEVEVRAPVGDGRGAPTRVPSRPASSPPLAAPRGWDMEAPATGVVGVPPEAPAPAVASSSPPPAPAAAAAAATAAAAAPVVAAAVGDGEEDEVSLAKKIDFFESYLRRLQRSADSPEQRGAPPPPPASAALSGGADEEPALRLADVMQAEAEAAAAEASAAAPPPTAEADAEADRQLAEAQAELDALLAEVTPPAPRSAPVTVPAPTLVSPAVPPPAAATAPTAPMGVPAGGASDALVKAALKEVAAEMKRYKKVMKAARKEHEARIENIVRGMAASSEGMQ